MAQGNDPFGECEQQAVIRIALADGGVLVGAYMTVAGMHFVHVPDGLQGKVHGPFAPGDVAGVEVAKSREQVFEERRERRMGEQVPGTLRRTRDGYEARLERLARVAATTPDFVRRMQVEAQFDAVADEVSLARTKRRWMLAVARWSLHSNEEPTKLDMSGGDMSSAEKFQRPRPQDFDPDPAVRRARVPVPARLKADPLSVWNMVRTLRRAGFNARASVFGAVREDSAELLVDFPGGKANGRFSLDGARGRDGAMAWRFCWDGNGSMADERRRRKAVAGADYATFRRIVATGTVSDRAVATQPEGKGSTPAP